MSGRHREPHQAVSLGKGKAFARLLGMYGQNQAADVAAGWAVVVDCQLTFDGAVSLPEVRAGGGLRLCCLRRPDCDGFGTAGFSLASIPETKRPAW